MFTKIIFFNVLLLILTFGLYTPSFADDDTPRTLSELQNLRSRARLFLPNFVVIGENASFKIVTKPFYNVELKLEYDNYETEIYTGKAGDSGLLAFNINILDDSDLVGKNVLVEAYVWSDENPSDKQKALPQDNNNVGQATMFEKVYITDKASAKGFVISPSQTLNKYIMNTNYSKDSGYNVYNNEFTYDTPIYIKNMRDARDNVREVRQTINYTNGQ